jgi:tagatose 1,6-diphosphate aldolase
MFQFIDFEQLTDGQLELVLQRHSPADLEKGYVPAYIFRIYQVDNPEQIGSIDIRIGNNENIRYGGHIGYEVYEKYRGRYYAARACEILRAVAKAHSMTELYITCNPEKIPSRKTCEQLGAKLMEIVDLPPDNEMYRLGERQKCRYLWQL